MYPLILSFTNFSHKTYCYHVHNAHFLIYRRAKLNRHAGFKRHTIYFARKYLIYHMWIYRWLFFTGQQARKQ